MATKTLEKPETPGRDVPSVSGNGNSDNVHGPSFLGLAEDPKVEFHYLYEDEQPRSHVGIIFFLLLVLGAAGYLGWQWKHGGFPFNRQWISSSGGAQTSASPSEVAPAQNQDQQTHIDKPMTGGAGNVQPLPPEPQQGQQPAAENKPGESNTKPPEAEAKPENTASENAAAEKPDEEKPAEPAAATKSQAKHATARTPVQKPAPKPAPAPGTQDADLEQMGERYLYGNGVPQNCARAESNLRTAATHGNTKAQTVLGTMYATGHCVGRDLPAAYRWFARALHQDPQNSRISADLQVLWRQMTPQEKQLATSGGQ